MAKKPKSASSSQTDRSAPRASSAPDAASDVPWPDDDMPWPSDMSWPEPMPWATRRGVAPVALYAAVSIVQRDGKEITGEDILGIAGGHKGEPYVLGARAPMGNANWKGPWDCAEFVSWCLYQASGILFGTEPRNDPVQADAYTGYWAQQARAAGCTVPVPDAVSTVGAILLRYPQPGAVGHIVYSDGAGGTVEAHSSKLGVIVGTVNGRRWDTGILVPGIRYYRSGDEIVPKQAVGVIRLTYPLTKSATVKKIQRRLVKLGYAPGSEDGVYGPQTAHAVRRFQATNRQLVVDGEVGAKTLEALEL